MLCNVVLDWSNIEIKCEQVEKFGFSQERNSSGAIEHTEESLNLYEKGKIMALTENFVEFVAQ